MSFILRPIDTVETIGHADFTAGYLKPRRPLVIKGLTNNWPARQKWTPEYLKQVVGNKVVPLYDNSKADPSKPINSRVAEMPFDEYIDLIMREPTELRIFFFNIFLLFFDKKIEIRFCFRKLKRKRKIRNPKLQK